MASRYPEINIFPKSGIDVRDPSAPEWVANLWRPSGSKYIQVRQGFGQVAQFNSSTADPSSKFGTATSQLGVGGYREHLGSYLFNTLYGQRQIVSVFTADVTLTDMQDPADGLVATGTDMYPAVKGLHGRRRGVILSIYDLTVEAHYEELFLVHTAQTTKSNEMIKSAHGHFESAKTGGFVGTEGEWDFRSLHAGGDEPVAFEQLFDSLVISSPDIGIWQYFGIDPVRHSTARIKGVNPDRSLLAGIGSGSVLDNANQFGDGRSESAHLVPVVGVRGLADNFTYIEDAAFPRINASASLGNVMCYATDSAVFFSDDGHPGSILGGNSVVANFDTPIRALQSFAGDLYAFTKNETWIVTVQYASISTDEPAKAVASATRISENIGCVGPRSLAATPAGLVWVSQSGVHIIQARGKVATISDPINTYWKDGLEDPVTNFYISSTAGTENQPSPVYRHKGKPTVAFSKPDDSILIAYEDHMLAFGATTKTWAVWPLKSVQGVSYNPIAPQTVEEYRPHKCVNVLADADGVYIVGGMDDPIPSVGPFYTSLSKSFYIASLGRGGALERSSSLSEDNRTFGDYYRWVSVADPSTPINNSTDHLLLVEPAGSYRSGGEVFFEYDVAFSTLADSTPYNKAANRGVRFPLYFSSDLSLVGFYVDPELTTDPSVGAGASNVTVTSFAASVLVDFNDGGLLAVPMGHIGRKTIKVGRLSVKASLPLLGNTVAGVTPGLLGLNTSEVTIDAVGNTKPGIYYTTSVVHPDEAINPADSQASPVQYAYKSGAAGLDESKNLRARGIYAVVETSGDGDVDPAATPRFGLYNAIIAGDRRLMSAQYKDYVGLDTSSSASRGNTLVAKAETVRRRLNSGKRTFGGGAVYSGAGQDAAYMVDSPERNTVAISASARGESLAALVFGFMSDKSQRLTIYRLFMAVKAWGSGRRRTGR